MQNTSPTNNSQQEKSRKDIQQYVTDTIIQQLENGIVPWQQPWVDNKKISLQIPKNGTTGKHYRGINIITLWGSSIQSNYTSNEWASFRQWQGIGQAIRQNEKGSLVVYYEMLEKEVNGEIKEIPFLKYSHVFNRSQLVDYKEEEKTAPISKEDLVKRLDIIERFVSNTGASITTDMEGARYDYDDDVISMPPTEDFIPTNECTATENYYSVLFHELTHWTGHPSRLNRLERTKFGNMKYAAEELTAEFGAAFTAAEFGISTIDKTNHVGYIDFWLHVLKKNKQCIFTASGEASKAVDYMHHLQPK